MSRATVSLPFRALDAGTALERYLEECGGWHPGCVEVFFDRAALAMALRTLRAARASIDMEMFLLGGQLGLRVLRLLDQKARAGVRVRLIHRECPSIRAGVVAKAALRRIRDSKSTIETSSALVFAHVRIDPAARRVWVEDQLVELTAVEFDLLVALARHHGMALSREQLLEKAWGYDYYGDTRVVDVHIGHIRQKLGEDRYIQTIRGIGYRFEDKSVSL